MKIDVNTVLKNLGKTDIMLGGFSVVVLWAISLLEDRGLGIPEPPIFGWEAIIIVIIGLLYLDYRIKKVEDDEP